jgi:hypothetical protein
VKSSFALVLLSAFCLTLTACSSGCGAGRYADPENCDQSDYADEDSYAEPANVDATDVEQPDFDNCTQDCSGHEAGFQWAQEHDLTDEDECGGNSDSFIEGCQAFVSERQDVAEEQAQDDSELDSGDDGESRY